MTELGYCRPMSAKISPRQCQINRDKDCYSCLGCNGLEDVQGVNLDEMVGTARSQDEEMVMHKSEEGAERRGRHLLCKVPGCDKLRVKDGMCTAHYRQSQAAKGAPETPAKKRRPVTSPPAKAGRLSALLPPPEPPATGYYLNLQQYPDLDAWLQEVCPDDIPGTIIELLEA
ncbi:MAG: hypothetical protein A4E69_01058 [Syntrophus sp. PtaB.Bin138]|nr:MAG: hypothetical protein A4E69_01058 [Syntrophus sp. PtaB.Bin138]